MPAEAAEAPAATGPLRHLVLPVEGMSCASCVGRVERALAALPGARDVAVNLATGTASLRLPEAADPAAVPETIRAAGYDVPETVTRIGIEGMSCASCSARVERVLNGLPGVTQAAVNLTTGRAEIRHAGGFPSREAIEAAIRAAGYEPRAVEEGSSDDRAARQAREAQHLRRDTLVAALLTLPIVVLDMGGHLVPGFHELVGQRLGEGGAVLQALLATLVLAIPGRRFFAAGLPGLLRGHPDMNALVALGSGAAYLYSLVSTIAPDWLPPGTAHLYFEASAVIVTLILLGRLLEARTKGQTGAAITRLIDLTPKTARVLRGATEQDVPITELRLGDIVRVRPGERVAADGIVVAGASYVDESMVSGEPVPVGKKPGDRTIGGTLNTSGSLDLRVDRTGADTMLAQIVRMVEAAQGGKLPIQALVDRVTLWFVPAVMAVSALTVLAWLAFGPSPALGQALVAAVAVLIVACPCAMGLATPTSILVGTGRAAERGVLFREGTALQALQDVKVVAFDKTGTLTEGHPRLTDLILAEGVTRAQALALAGAIESRSEHPIARAVVAAARDEAITLPPVEAFAAEAGFGVSGRIDGRSVAIGARRFMERLGIATEGFAAASDDLARQGRSPLYLALDGKIAALFAVADPIKAEARGAVTAIRAGGRRVALITGDGRATAEAVARELGIEDIVAEVLPGGKVEALKSLRSAHGPVAFVGDGINDAPALAEADVGIAMGTGTDIAVESADVVLMTGRTTGVAEALALSRAVMANIRQNLFWAFAYNVALIPVAAGLPAALGGPLFSPALAAGAMALSSLFVLGNALRLRRAGAAT
ncbi:heavy metal translocating P-type ATPase [Methylobacterium organophilum]|uniref:heavy metal translocating P-type ATPase n=1 Tax=Methylobacterium organophilum TaxID=410 RepID=UPI001F1291C7|nr:heavy metal translocating P-type ATPase [Methylobacterium organophilum]UMY15998.1 heavy metal translocating P-type ATPase [Methylobacterium organophilum]